MSYKIQVNGTEHQVEADGNTPLLWILRDTLGMTGTKYGCGVGACGACTVHVDGAAMRSCLLPIEGVTGRITTIEGLASSATSSATLGDWGQRVQAAWIEHQVPQCGYCQSGMIMAVAALLQSHPAPSDADIDASVTNICRCGTYERIRFAVHSLAGRTQQEASHE